MSDEKKTTTQEGPNQYEPAADPPAPNDVNWDETMAKPAGVANVPFTQPDDVNLSEDEKHLANVLDKIGVNDEDKPDPAVIEAEKVIEDLKDKPDDSATEEPQSSTLDESADKEELPEPDIPLDIFEDTTPDADDKETDVSGILKKYLGENVDDEVAKAAEPIAKAYKELQRQQTQAQKEAATLQALVEKLANGEAVQSQAKPDGEKGDEQPAENAAPVDSFQMPSEEELEQIVAEQGYAGLVKTVVDLQQKAAEAREAQQRQKMTAEQQKRMEQERLEHNNALLYERARELLRDRAIAKRDKDAIEKYSDEKYRVSEDEFLDIYPVLETELDVVRQYMAPDDHGKFSKKHLDLAKRIAHFDRYVKQAEQRGYQRALKDVKSQQSTRVSATPRGNEQNVATGLKIDKNAPIYEIKQQLDNVPAEKIDAELQKLKEHGLF